MESVTPAAEILAAAYELDPETQREIGEKLLAHAQEVENLTEAEWDEAWGDEAERRLAELRDGTVKAVPGELVRARMRAIVNS